MTRLKVGDLILIYFYDSASHSDRAKQRVSEKRLAVVLTEVADKDGYIQAQYIEERVGVRIANLLPRSNGLDQWGRVVTEIVSR
jgi:hypothetical protein